MRQSAAPSVLTVPTAHCPRTQDPLPVQQPFLDRRSTLLLPSHNNYVQRKDAVFREHGVAHHCQLAAFTALGNVTSSGRTQCSGSMVWHSTASWQPSQHLGMSPTAEGRSVQGAWSGTALPVGSLHSAWECHQQHSTQFCAGKERVTPCRLQNAFRRFEGTCHLHSEGSSN